MSKGQTLMWLILRLITPRMTDMRMKITTLSSTKQICPNNLGTPSKSKEMMVTTSKRVAK